MATPLKIFADGPLLDRLRPVAGEFQRVVGATVELIGDHAPALHRRIVGGEPFDVVLIQPDWLLELQKAGLASARPIVVSHQVEIGLAIRADRPELDVSRDEALRASLCSADAILINTVASGQVFEQVLRRLGVLPRLASKIERVAPQLLYGRLDTSEGTVIGVGTVPVIRSNPKLRLLGPLPAEWRSVIDYAPGISASTTRREVAEAFVACLQQQGRAAQA